MAIHIDDGKRRPTKMQFFVATKSIKSSLTVGIPDAKDNVDDALMRLAEDMSWTTGVKRFFYTPPRQVDDHIANLKSTIFSLLSSGIDVMVTNHLPRREMYLYYTASKQHDLEYADAEYMCFEVPSSSIEDVSILIMTALIMSREDVDGHVAEGVEDAKENKSIASAAEAAISPHRGTIKVKLMPRGIVQKNWSKVAAIIGDDLADYFISHQKR